MPKANKFLSNEPDTIAAVEPAPARRPAPEILDKSRPYGEIHPPCEISPDLPMAHYQQGHDREGMEKFFGGDLRRIYSPGQKRPTSAVTPPPAPSKVVSPKESFQGTFDAEVAGDHVE